MASETPNTNDREVYALPIGPPGSNQVVVPPPTWMIPTKLVAPPIPPEVGVIEGEVEAIEAVHPREEKRKGKK